MSLFRIISEVLWGIVLGSSLGVLIISADLLAGLL